jgi:phosphate transport system substrate-binding protein
MFSSQLSSRLVGVFAVLASVSAMATDVTGAGATFPYAVYTKWAEAYKTATQNGVNYQGIGSSGGIQQIKAKTIDFGGTDAPLSADDLTSTGLVQFPAVMGGCTIVFNLSGMKSGEIKLDGATAADIFRGAITKWNDPAIAKLNKGVKLPATDITIVHRSDGSGTTYVFTNYLAMQSEAFKKDVGAGKEVNWPAASVGGKGNPGVAASVQKIDGAIGYVDYADAMQNNLPFVSLKNKAGDFVMPTKEAMMAAAAHADFEHAAGMAPNLLDQDGQTSWPLVSATYILVYGKIDDASRGKGVLEFYDWSLHHGQSMAGDLGFVALPDNVVKMVEANWMKNVKDAAGNSLWK